MPWSLTRGQTVALALLVAALLIDAVLTLHNIREVAISVQWVSHTHEVLGQLEQVVSTLKDAETGQRGYLLTGERRLPRALRAGGAAGPGRSSSGSGSSPSTIRRRPRTCSSSSSSRPSGSRCSGRGSTASRPSPTGTGRSQLSRQYLLQGEGKRLMDLVRDEIYGMQQLERALLARREAASRANTRTALASTVVGLGLGLVLIAMVITLVARNLAARQRAADVLHAERERFRTTLTSIGDAVVVTDAQGRITLLNPVAQALTGWGAEALGQPLDAVFRIVNETTREPMENPVSKVHPPRHHRGPRQPHRADRQGRHASCPSTTAARRSATPAAASWAWCWSSATSPSGGARSARWRTPIGARTSSSPCWPTSCGTRSRRSATRPTRWPCSAPATTGCGGSRASSSGRSGSMTRLVDDLLDVSRITSGKITLQRDHGLGRGGPRPGGGGGAPARGEPGADARRGRARGRGLGGRGSGAAGPGGRQPPRQRDQVHRRRRGGSGSARGSRGTRS